jgi:Ca-activated chloride channel family protein
MDELERLKAELRAEADALTPAPGARATAIAAATAHFKKISQTSLQGTQGAKRLSDRAGAIVDRIRGRPIMQSIRLSHVLMMGTSLAVLTLVAVNMQALTPLLRAPLATLSDEVKEEADQSTSPLEPAPKVESRIVGEVAPPKQEPGAKVLSRTPELSSDFATEFYSYLPASPPSPEAGLTRNAAKAKLDAMAPGQSADAQAPYYHDQGRDKFTDIKSNPVKVTAEEPVSTFSIDVDTASYAFVRAALNNSTLPQKDAVRVEEMINYFPYDYAGPADRSEPFKTTASVFPAPWNPDHRLLHIGIKGFSLNGQEKPRSNLVFLIDTSGSMNEPNKLPLLQNAMKMLVETLGPEDTVSIVTYAGNAGTLLEPTKIKDKRKIIAALDSLSSEGSTAGAEGIRKAYQLAEQTFDKAGINRVILATDGDFNVGITDPEELKSFVERKRETGVYLSVLGFGMGNYNDELMQTLAQNGNGNAAFVDSINEARKVLVDEASSTLFPIAKDVKIQVEFNRATVSEYRLIGYETRLLNREDFNNDKVDAGEIGAGHTVTAIYEFVPKGSATGLVDELRYDAAKPAASAGTGEYAFVKLRYKLPDSDTSKLIEVPVAASSEVKDLAAIPEEARFAAAVAAFGQLLRGGQYTKSFTYDDVIALAQGAKGSDAFGYRAEFVNLVRLAKTAQALEPLQQP